MLHRAVILPVLAGLVAAQSTTTISNVAVEVVPTPDALPYADLRNVEVPSYTSVDGLSSEVSSYVTATAIAAAVADVNENPLSVFPAVTSIPINAAGEDDSAPTAAATPVKREADLELDKRTACAPQATISNFYGVNIDSYSAFKADATISSVALAAPTPVGYFNSFKNSLGANSAYSYLGYSIVNGGKTGYDVNWCANKCNSISGCLSFNIYFERDPVLEPGTGCTNPNAFANIKCSFWGTGLDLKTATNYGQWRSQFQVAIAGSNSYNSFKLGGPIDGWDAPQSLNTSAMNAPLRDCAGTWTYLGYKLFQAGPYNPLLCSAACDAQTAYNLANPPSDPTVKPAKCAAFGTYILTLTNKTGSYQQGQMCTMYTSNWDKQYATNTVGYDDAIGAKYTYSFSFFYSKPNVQPICTSDINYLISSGSDFCTSFNAYSAPSTTTTTTVTPATSIVSLTPTSTTTIFATPATTTFTALRPFKRQDNAAETTSFSTVSSVPPYSAVILATFASTHTVANGSVPTGAPSNLVAAKRAVAGRAAIPTPSNVVGWPSSRISEACSAVATGTFTIPATTTLATSTSTTIVSTATLSTTLSACVIPSQLPDYLAFTPIWGTWNGDALGDNPYSVASAESAVQLPFSVALGTESANVVVVGTDGYIKVGAATFAAFSGQGDGLYLYGGKNGVFHRITGPIGSRQVVFSWYAGTYDFGHEQNHFTITYFENRPNVLVYKYYDVVMQPGPYGSAFVANAQGSVSYIQSGELFTPGEQIVVNVNADGSASGARSLHQRVDCCVKNAEWWGGWHSCTEFQPAAEP